jgi:small subunit ribosomal protein S1
MSENSQDVNAAAASSDGGDDRSSPGAPKKPREGQSAAGAQPSFEEIMRAASAPPPPPAQKNAVVIKRALPVPVQASVQPSFEEIMAGVTVSPEAALAAAAAPSETPAPSSSAPASPRESRPPRPQRKEQDPRRMPVVVRKPSLPKPGEPVQAKDAPESAAVDPAGASGGAAGMASPESAVAAAADGPGQGQGQGQEEAEPAKGGGREKGRRQGRERGASGPAQPLAESVFATPGADETQDFAALFAEQQQTQPRQGRLRPGQKVQAKVAHLGAEVAFLDLGGKGEGIIDLRELRNDKGEMLVQVGEPIEGYVLSLGEGTVVVTRSVPKGAGREVLQYAFDAHLPVEGTVTAVNKGGLEIDLGGMRAFCPASQIDVRFVDDTSVFVGQKLKFLVQELRGGNAILSRRALLEEERKGKAAELRKTLDVGSVLEGTVTSVREFGAFVDLGGIEGLVHVSELSHARVVHAQDVVKVGQNVRVQVLRIDPPGPDKTGRPGGSSGERIALSLRALEQDPWDAARPQLEEGKKLQGKVARLQPFGAFVELFPGVDGLVHVSALSPKHVTHPREVVKEGETIWVQIESVDDAARRVALRRITEEEAQQEGPVPAPARGGRERGEKHERGGGPDKPAPGPRARVGDMVDAKVERVEAYGVFVAWPAGKGLIPNAELGTPRGSDNKKTTPVGTEFKAQIIEIDDRGRYRLSRTSAERASDRADYERYQRAQKPAGKGFGTIGDLLRAKLAEREEE